MKLSLEHLTINKPTEQDILTAIESCNSGESSYLILEDHSGSYLQCTGLNDQFTVEKRYQYEGDFRHVVIGTGFDISPLKVTWSTIKSKVGPIRVHSTEVLNSEQVINIFNMYHKGNSIQYPFKERNVTKVFK